MVSSFSQGKCLYKKPLTVMDQPKPSSSAVYQERVGSIKRKASLTSLFSCLCVEPGAKARNRSVVAEPYLSPFSSGPTPSSCSEHYIEMGTLLMIAGTLWASLLVYNFITALFGINTFRVKYIELLRWLYSVFIVHVCQSRWFCCSLGCVMSAAFIIPDTRNAIKA